jgi:hypothetical protein
MPLFFAIGHGSYSLGSYGHLQDTINFFNQTGSFSTTFLTSGAGFSTSFMLDPIWADPAVCQPGETPLVCEIRLKRPAVAIIYIGIMDMITSTPEAYQSNLEAIVRTLIDSGTIPVLTTLTASEVTIAAHGRTETFKRINGIIRDTAARHRIPLIEFQQAAYPLPNQGTVEDGHHLSFRVDGTVNFNGDQNVYGKDLRELMTLQMLHDLKTSVMGF